MKILITGSKGQLARELQLELAGAGKLLALGHNALDLSDSDQVREQVRLLRPDLIINAAAYTAVDPAESHRELAFAVNARGPQVLAEEAARLGVPLIHYSTDYVFDGRKGEPYCEADVPQPLSVYGASKLAGEQAIQAVGGEYLILRTSWVYSQHGKNFLLTMQRLLQERDALSVVSDEIGTPTWAATIARTTAEMVRKRSAGEAGPSGLYHLTASGETSWYGFACSIAEQLRQQGRLRAEITPILSKDYPTAAQRPLNSRLNCARLQQDWGIRLPDWETALHECLAQSRHFDAANAPQTAAAGR
ncbi:MULTISPECIES: dTDP-4-dehydrorhamnose reductase [Stutzerimonas stutzeri subgroup]|uniref:dTDP-4-dehydrorhamnose reductase n=2 Tax=Stutzerimonas stutzeri subgroup TaxID=578833 RepID=A0A9X1SRG6_9GAMM|nr:MULTISPECIES: dTDP-4-dehydrorhamnose reductase [Stutzerimonas stutzeri subgroup]TVT66667.1 MAG: dTDP-4-dehydrorhamnose reductase [Pseudomonas sp.]AFM35414.1 dTDP-4-dehydrorhamnose reductase [Stutzerimonas stutzeri CCUG 29243]MCD1609998.1 dTDP-4-dehydrorhamnose reductase [Stutzerimonas kunmingensis]MCQ2038437.1 dTDP-4-dehydrorhamnose reductase [Stutzerimonas kunmingensis]PNF99708.1 dTDP-4-dehydrorhamnose reductase [Stutzerimonas kunmingensis]